MVSRNDIGTVAHPVSGTRRSGRDLEDAAAASRLVRGQVVEVRPAAEILATLDADFRLEGLPFMPEMLRYCGRRMTVYRHVYKTCVEGHGMRAMRNAVLLADGICDGAAHDGCQKHCLIFWNEAWLKPVEGADMTAVAPDAPHFDDLYRTLAEATRDGERYKCQSSLLHEATLPLSTLGLVEYFQEFRGGELSVGQFVAIVGRALLNKVRAAFGIGPIGSVHGGRGPHAKGDLNLQPGEYVEVRSIDEISRTVGPSGKNRGLQFEPDMTPFAGKQLQVDFRVDKFVSEETGEMVHMTNTVALKNVHCSGLCTKNCPRSVALYWREAWVKRVGLPGRAP